MLSDQPLRSQHFSLQSLSEGVFACIHRAGGAAFSNAGIIDLGGQTLVLDTLHTRAAGEALRRTAEALFDRPVETIALTHGHNDHWIGACAFDGTGTLVSSTTTQEVCREWGPLVREDFHHPTMWQEMLAGAEEQYLTENDPRHRVGLEKNIRFFRYIIAEKDEFQPRTPDLAFEGSLAFEGTRQTAELRSLGRGHSEDDAVLLLPEEGIAFIGDLGFFDSQPLLNCEDLPGLRRQIGSLMDSEFEILVPGHGPVGGKEHLARQIEYLDFLEDRVGTVVKKKGALEAALQITLPEPFDQWLLGGMQMFEDNLRTMYVALGGEVPE